MLCRAWVTSSTSELRLEVSWGVRADLRDVRGAGRTGLELVGGGEEVLNEIGRPGRASRQLGESERL